MAAVAKLRPLSDGRRVQLGALDAAAAATLAPQLATIEPWVRLGTTSPDLERLFLCATRPGRQGWCIRVDEQAAGAMIVEHNWLLGPYLMHLSVAPAYQRQGLARRSLGWWETVARGHGARNLWLCVSSFNDPAKALYQAKGFRQVGVLDNLLVEGFDEVLMRKRLELPS